MEGCSYPEEQHTHSTCSCDPSQQQAGQIPQGFRDSRQQQQQFFTHYFHFATGKTVEDQTKHNERSKEYSGWVQEFLFTLHMVQINLWIILLLHLGFRLRGQSKTTASDLKETSFPLAAVQMFGLKLLKLLRQEILRLKLLKMLSNVKRGATEGSSDPDSVCYSILNTNTSLGSVNF